MTSATKVWLEFRSYVPHHSMGCITMCGLCGNSGVIDTRNVKTQDGTPCGVEAFCICPNGRQAKKAMTDQQKWSGDSVSHDYGCDMRGRCYKPDFTRGIADARAGHKPNSRTDLYVKGYLLGKANFDNKFNQDL